MKTVVSIDFKGVILFCKIDGTSEEFELQGVFAEDPNCNAEAVDLYDTYCDMTIDKILGLCTELLSDLEHDAWSIKDGYETDGLLRLSDVLDYQISRLERL